MIVPPQHCIRLPTLPIQVGVVGRVAAALGERLVSLQVLISLTEGWVEEASWVVEGGMGG